MKSPRFLLVAPRFVTSVGQYYEFPIGLAHISSSLKSMGYDVSCVNLNHSSLPIGPMLREIVIDRQIDVLCTGGLSIHFNKIKEILDSARSARDGLVTVLGGGIVSSDPHTVMQALRPDFGVIGEGELTIRELAVCIAEGSDPRSVEGLIYFAGAKLKKTAPRKPITDLGEIAYPDYDGFEIGVYLDMQMTNDEYHMYPYDRPRVIPVTASRSCPYRCTFCFHPLGNTYRQRPLDDLFAEIQLLIEKYQVNILSIVDELFSMDDERIEEFCARIKDLDLKYLVQMRVDSVNESVLRQLKESGCIAISYGLESASDAILKSMKKHTTVAMIEKALAATYDAGIGIQGNFIFGDPEETSETAEETIAWWNNNRRYHINLTPVYIYPGTELYSKALERRVIGDPIGYLEAECPVTNVSRMKDEEYSRLLCRISQYRTDNPIPARVISCRQIFLDPLKGEVYSLTVRCPHCGETVSYRNIHQRCNNMYPLGCRIGCRSCNQRFDILPPMIHERILNGDVPKDAAFFENAETIAIYGAGLASIPVYQQCVKLNKQVLYFIDDLKEGEWCGLPVFRPDTLHDESLPDLTIFSCGSMRYAANLLARMEQWDRTKKVFISNAGDAADNDNYLFYFNIYREKWLPLESVTPGDVESPIR